MSEQTNKKSACFDYRTIRVWDNRLPPTQKHTFAHQKVFGFQIIRKRGCVSEQPAPIEKQSEDNREIIKAIMTDVASESYHELGHLIPYGKSYWRIAWNIFLKPIWCLVLELAGCNK